MAEDTTGVQGRISGEITNSADAVKFYLPKRKFQWGKGLTKEIDMSGKFIKDIAQLPDCCTDSDAKQTEIQEFFRDADVFITGATGFFGKLLIEKLLVTCPTIGNLYLLIREKRGKSFEERFNDLFGNYVFTRLHKLVPNFRSKLIAINGDCSKAGLGLSETDYKLLTERVSVIFHGAATVSFDEKLKVATRINVQAVLDVVKLAKDCKCLKSMMHLSTAYAHCTIPVVREMFYPPAYDYKKLVDLVEKESDEVIEKMNQNIIEPWPNTYTFTKQVAEDALRVEGQDLPLGIYRPGMVIATYNEPVKSWCDNLYNVNGVIMGVGTGALRVWPADGDKALNVVPVDMAVNGLIAAAWKAGEDFKKGKRNIEIYNYVSTRNPVLAGEYYHWNHVYGIKWGSTMMLWYPMCMMVSNKLWYLILSFLLHTVPAFAVDAVCVLRRKKPLMRRIYSKIGKFADVIYYFVFRDWYFPDDNVLSLWESLSPKDKEIYPFDIADVDWDYQAQSHVLGLRVSLLKDDIDTLPQGRKKLKRLHALHKTVQVLLILLLSWMLYKLYLIAST